MTILLIVSGMRVVTYSCFSIFYLEREVLMQRNLLVKFYIIFIGTILLFSSPSFAGDKEKQFQPIQTFDGIGITAESAAAGYRVTGVFRNSPAYMKVKTGDIITKIDGISTRHKINDWFYHNIRKPAGSTIDLEISRMGEWVNLRLKTAKIEINKITIPVSSIAPLKITEIEGDNIIIGLQSSGDPLKIGDSFFVFDGDKHVGYVRIKSISEGKAILKGENLKENVTSQNFRKLDLRYFACFTSRQRVSSSGVRTGRKTDYLNSGNKPVNKDYQNGKPEIKVESYSMYLDGTRLLTKAIIRNSGTAPARGVVCTCFFVNRNDKIIGQKSLEIRVLNVGERKVCIYGFAQKINTSSNYVEFRDNNTRVKIYQGLSSLNPVLVDMECKFNFE